MSFPNLNSFSTLLALEPIFGSNSQIEKRMINNDTGQVLYLGLNITPGAATSASTWAVIKCSYDGNGFLNYYQLPVSNGFGPYYVWDNVTDYF